MKASTQCILICLFLTTVSLILDMHVFVIIAIIIYPAYFICRAIEDKQ